MVSVKVTQITNPFFSGTTHDLSQETQHIQHSNWIRPSQMSSDSTPNVKIPKLTSNPGASTDARLQRNQEEIHPPWLKTYLELLDHSPPQNSQDPYMTGESNTQKFKSNNIDLHEGRVGIKEVNSKTCN
ncbi:hypothetical protein PGT21_004289 [Puccinia graminis f. sp. tritici]|uniref:Uncharacterized protein n=1 Tax=Puccinia graminis f. sp. tritici TaxID=56615 RepID=A0A5B0NCU5_PUCGR|nr:hypothetical protein PGT21_004289 [Puccinia graminis f. sp. tritici]